MNFTSGIMDRTRLVANVLMLVLLAGNIFFSIQYTEGVKREQAQADKNASDNAMRFQTARFLKEFIDVVLTTQGTISFDDRVKLESDVRQLGDAAVTNIWTTFVNSKDSKDAQSNAIKLMSMLSNKMI